MAKKTDTVEAPVTTDLIRVPEAALAMTPDRAVRVEDDADYRDIQELMAQYGAIEFPGANIVPKLHMLGIPFIIAGVRFQDTMVTSVEGRNRDFVSLAAFVQTADIVQDAIDKGRVMKSAGRDAECYTSIEDLPVRPEERIIINDGSTGVRRQIVGLLQRLQLIEVGDREDRLNGRKDIHDLAWDEWENPFLAEDYVPSSWTNAVGHKIPEFPSFIDGRPFIVRADRGLTASVYPNELAPSGWATTYYVR